MRDQNNSLTVSTDHQRGTKRFEQSLPTRDPSPFTINVLDTGATDQKKKKKKDSRRHWSTSYRRTQNDFICVCNLHLKWLPDKRYNLLSQYRSFPTSVAHFQRFLRPPHFGRPGVTPRPPAQFTDQLLQTWMLLDMATFELEKFNTKKCLVQSRFYFLKKEEEEEEITHILKKSERAGSELDWGIRTTTASNLLYTVLSLTHMNLIPVECCWAKESVWGQTGLEAHWKTLHLNLKWRQKQRNGAEPVKWRRWSKWPREPPPHTCQSGGITGYYGYKTSWKTPFSSFTELPSRCDFRVIWTNESLSQKTKKTKTTEISKSDSENLFFFF